MMYDVITIGSATVDIYMKSADFHLQKTDEGVLLCQEYGGKMDINLFQMASGGAGTNTAVGFSRMGFKTAAVVEIGKDVMGQVVWDQLQREHVETEFVITEKSEETAVSVLLISGDGGRSALTHRGASSMLEARDIPWNALKETRWIHLSNVSANTELLFTLFDFMRENTVGLSWNPGKKELEMMAEDKILVERVTADMLFMNAEEWEVVKPIQERILKQIPQVIITEGFKGGKVYLKGEYQFTYQAVKVDVTQETGAGDAYVTGFVSAHLSGEDLLQACQWGVQNSTSVIQKMDAKQGLLTKPEVLSRIDKANSAKSDSKT